MNTIIIHPYNRITHTPSHDITAALITPVPKWYRSPPPWWVLDGTDKRWKGKKLTSITEVDEEVEVDGDVVVDDVDVKESRRFVVLVEDLKSRYESLLWRLKRRLVRKVDWAREYRRW
ncbi:hypothetical protein M378DRAFT_159264 [Amanita muscaria Koide BX008]|uniref:Uncharacterized protein n=1 Tax=Amanita muscaria (strain Koide BX008) TaxID=946122 RepID=A0A0C2XF38_AMAMK|nr:hypothetical protein M378DRAFT_159264 [Amanita muscaria Koide BX008]